MIRKQNIYCSDTGRTVREWQDIEGKLPSVFSGVVRVKVVPKLADKNPTFEKDFEFPFPDEVITLEDAFKTFDDVCQKQLDARNQKVGISLVEKPSVEKTGEKAEEPIDKAG